MFQIQIDKIKIVGKSLFGIDVLESAVDTLERVRKQETELKQWMLQEQELLSLEYSDMFKPDVDTEHVLRGKIAHLSAALEEATDRNQELEDKISRLRSMIQDAREITDRLMGRKMYYVD